MGARRMKTQQAVAAVKFASRSVFRWQYVAPRAALAIALVLGVRYGLDPTLRWALVSGGEAAIGAKVEIADLTTSLRGGELNVSGVAVANPQRPMRNLVDAAHLRLCVDAAQLLRKRVVVRDGLVAGLQFDSQRTTSGALETSPEPTEPSALDPLMAAAQDRAVAWIDDLGGRAQQDLLAALATPRVIEEMEQRWPRQYEALKARTEELATKSKRIEATFREVKKNPLRNLPQLESLQKELVATQAELKTTMAEIQALPAQAKADRGAVDAARKQDEQFFREHLKLTNIDAGELNRYLLGETASGYVSQAAYWIEQARRLMPKKSFSVASRVRGTNVLFLARRQPALLIEQLRLNGNARVDGEALAFTGTLSDATSEPELHERPLRLCLVSTGAIAGDCVVELDRRGATPHDSLKLNLPSVKLAQRTLGKADKLAVNVTPGEASLTADVTLDGEELSGVIEFRQSSTVAAATPMLRDDRLAAMLQESLSGVDRLAATVRLGGTLKRPDVAIESNLGPQLAAGVDGAVRKYLTDRKDRMVAKLQQRVDEQVAKLEARRQEAQQELLGKLGEQQQLVQQVASLMGGLPAVSSAGIPQLGKAISLDRLTR